MELKVNIQDARSSGTDQRDLSWSGNEQKDQTIQQTQQVKQKDGLISQGLFLSLGKSVFSQIAGRIGTYTGDYMIQNNINNLLNAGTTIAAVVTLNPVAIGLTILSLTANVTDYQMKVVQSNTQSEALARLTGTSASNRSRGSGSRQ
jgi:hypothetical protein